MRRQLVIPVPSLTGAELNRWRDRHQLYARELAHILGIPLSTLNGKLSDQYPPRLDTERAIEMIDMLLRLGCAPPGWPDRLWRHVHDNNQSYNVVEFAARGGSRGQQY